MQNGNTNNIIKPGVLNTNNHVASASGNIDLSSLKDIIAEIVREQNQILIQMHNPTIRDENDSDQTIDVNHANNLNDMDKIPDVVKSLREFSGQPGEFGSWKKSVERILKIYEGLKGTPKYYGILSVIRNKITGNADTALESYNTPLNWDKISKCLTLHYADKRDLGTLEYQLTTLVQRGNSVPEFYHQVYYHLSLILNKLSSMEMSQESLNIMTKSYRDKALDTFVRGLKGDLPRLLSMREPTDLPQALHLCLKLENVHYRVQHSHGNVRNTQFVPPPPLPPKKNFIQQQRPLHMLPRNNFYPELLHNPQPPQVFSRQYFPRPTPPQQFQQFSRPIPPQQFQQISRPFNTFQNSFPKQEPMDVDRSMQSRQVSYQNRAMLQQPTQKRPLSGQTQQPAKAQRIFHAEQSAEDTQIEGNTADDNYEQYQEYQEAINSYDESYDTSLEEYIEPQTEVLDDIHFLD